MFAQTFVQVATQGQTRLQRSTRLYAKQLSETLSNAEIVEAERYYESTEGKKSLNAIKKSQAEVQQYIQQKSSEALQAELAGIMQAVRQAAAEHAKSSDEVGARNTL